MKNKILITGVNGFVGQNLLGKIQRGNELYGLDIVFPQREGLIKTYGWDDFSDIKDADIDTIIHLAGKAHDTRNQSKREEYFDINTELTKKIFDLFLRSEAKKFIFFSSIKAAADKSDDIINEDVIPNPVGPYAESKLAAEEYILKRLRAEDSKPIPQGEINIDESVLSKSKRVYILRPCMIHGPGNKGNLNSLVNLVRKGIPYPLGAFENKRTFTSIDNLCFVINELINKDVPSGIYNMADDDAVSTNNLVGLIAEGTGRKPRIWHISKRVLKAVAKAGSALHLPYNTLTLQKLTENYIASNEKLKKALGIEKMPVNAIDGLKRTIETLL